MQEWLQRVLDVAPPLAAIPEPLLVVILTVLIASVILAFVSVMAMFLIWLERKVSAHMQDRLGPMRVGGWHGWAQSIADGVKLLFKEDIVPEQADRMIFALAPMVVFASAFAAFVVIPFSPSLIVSDLNIGLLYLVAISSIVVIGIMMAGWSSNNKWALYGAIRSAAQIISYEIPAGFALLTSIMLVGSLSMQDISEAQAGGIHHWLLFNNPFSFVAFFIYYCAALAEVNRTPFDIPEAESELVAGYHTEYSGMRFAIFFLAEYANMFAVSAIATTLFLGGWNGILPMPILPAVLTFIAKCLLLIFVMMWLRWTLPRLRVDQLMYMSWKVLLPFSAVCVVGVGLWMMVLG
jgi:NADH-quinone oxidoreductase subunit H